jgi:hypothetical protein
MLPQPEREGIARRTGDMSGGDLPPRVALERMISAYRTSQAIRAAAALGLADHLKDGPKSSEQLARTTGTHTPSLYRLLRALASVGLVEEDEGGRFRLTPVGAYLRSDVPGSLRASAIALNEPWYHRAWEGLLSSVQTGEVAFGRVHGMGFWEYCARNPEAGAAFNAAMTGGSTERASTFLASYDLSGVGTLVDVGGGQGRLLAAVLAAHPSMRGVLYDRPEVVAGAEAVLREAGVADRCRVAAGDFFEAVPRGGDAYVLSLIIHDWNDERAVAILKSCHRAMAAGKKLLLIERVIAPRGAPDFAAFTDLSMLVLFGGRERTEAEFRALFEAAGFMLTRVIPTSAQWSVIEGVRT